MIPKFSEADGMAGPRGTDRPAEAAAQPPAEGKGGLKQYRRVLTFFVLGSSWGLGVVCQS